MQADTPTRPILGETGPRAAGPALVWAVLSFLGAVAGLPLFAESGYHLLRLGHLLPSPALYGKAWDRAADAALAFSLVGALVTLAGTLAGAVGILSGGWLRPAAVWGLCLNGFLLLALAGVVLVVSLIH
jgi:hypothetical protein